MSQSWPDTRKATRVAAYNFIILHKLKATNFLREAAHRCLALSRLRDPRVAWSSAKAEGKLPQVRGREWGDLPHLSPFSVAQE